MAKSPPSHLRLVTKPTERKQIGEAEFKISQDQRTLFASENPALLIFVEFDAATEAEFVSLIVSARPKVVFDLRLAPRFDVGAMNRKLVFALFQDAGARYYDVSGALGVKQARDARLNPALLGDSLRAFAEKKSPVLGPMLILVDPPQFAPEFVDGLASELDGLSKSGWSTMRVPEVVRLPSSAARSTIFISHATPDDNDFARWLASQLTLAGYDVWVDFKRLEGGELFWDTIENIIRTKAAKVLVVASELAQKRPGVLDEVNLALSVERAQALEKFVIPLKVDQLPHSEFRANILRRNILDFSRNWAEGLASLLEALRDDRVPRDSHSASSVADVVHHRLQVEPDVVAEPEDILLNWLSVEALPKALSVYEFSAPANKLAALSRTINLPNVPYGDGVLTFAPADCIADACPPSISLKSRGAVLSTEFLKGTSSQFSNMATHEARKIIANLIRQSWEKFAAAKGLKRFELAARAGAWYHEDQFAPSNKIVFRDHRNDVRRKTLVGFSAKRSVFWHFALEMRVAPGMPFRLIAKPHVIFSADGREPIQSKARMHALRRGFCKTWWNDRWRDLTAAFLAHLATEDGKLRLPVGGENFISVDSKMTTVVSSVRPASDIVLDVAHTETEHAVEDEEPEDLDLDVEELELLIGSEIGPVSVELDS